MELVLATRNRKKIVEIKRIAAGLPLIIDTLDDFPECPEVEEDGTTFEDNAVKKAVTIADCTGRPALADDSGLEVAALHGAPGIHSARYAGEHANDAENIAKLLWEMRAVDNRAARFVCCIALAIPTDGVHVFPGAVEGRIGKEPRGAHGFGYDPVFYPSGSDRTFAEMDDDEKDAVSHRGQSLRALKYFLEERFSSKGHAGGKT